MTHFHAHAGHRTAKIIIGLRCPNHDESSVTASIPPSPPLAIMNSKAQNFSQPSAPKTSYPPIPASIFDPSTNHGVPRSSGLRRWRSHFGAHPKRWRAALTPMNSEHFFSELRPRRRLPKGDHLMASKSFASELSDADSDLPTDDDTLKDPLAPGDEDDNSLEAVDRADTALEAEDTHWRDLADFGVLAYLFLMQWTPLQMSPK
eukprot:scaffold309_cov235-Pinguiococcus_pyrenoidosus.AAC.19